MDNTSDFKADSSTTDYGSYAIDTTGAWTYTLNNENVDVQGLNEGEYIDDSFTVETEDGTSETITIRINGTNDAPTASDLSVDTDEDTAIISGSYLATRM